MVMVKDCCWESQLECWGAAEVQGRRYRSRSDARAAESGRGEDAGRKFDLLVVCVRSSVGVVLFGWGVPELKSPARFWRGRSADFSPAMTPSPHWQPTPSFVKAIIASLGWDDAQAGLGELWDGRDRRP